MDQAGLRPNLLSTAQNPQQRTGGRLSRLWRLNQERASSASSTTAPGKTFVVPLFLATSRSSARNNLFAQGPLPTTSRSRTSTRSVIDNTTSRPGNMQPLSMPYHDQDEVSDMYGGSFSGSRSMTRGQAGSVLTGPDVEDVRSTSSSSRTRPARSGSSHSNHSPGRSGSHITTSSRSGSRSTHSSSRGGQRRVSRSKRPYRDPRISAKARISFAFGITLVIAIIIYLVLTFTGTARGIMFHVLSIFLILTLAGVFFHQIVSMLMLRRRPVKPRHRTAHSSRHQHARQQAREAGLVTDELPPEKPIQIHMASDDGLGPDLETGEHPAVVRKPPPIYGNTRTSMRINPDFVYAKQVAPSPVTPTYDEAMTQIQHTVGYRPPSYLSESGASEIVASQARDVDAALENIHPLERERMRILAADALEGRS